MVHVILGRRRCFPLDSAGTNASTTFAARGRRRIVVIARGGSTVSLCLGAALTRAQRYDDAPVAHDWVSLAF